MSDLKVKVWIEIITIEGKREEVSGGGHYSFKGKIVDKPALKDSRKLINFLGTDTIDLDGDFERLSHGDLIETLISVEFRGYKNFAKAEGFYKRLSDIELSDNKFLLEINGIGPVTAQKIIDYSYSEYNESPVLMALKDENFLNDLEIRDELKKSFVEGVKRQVEFVKKEYFSYKLMDFGFPSDTVNGLRDYYKESLYMTLSKDPYKALDSGIAKFWQIDSYAISYLGFDINSEERLVGSLLYALKQGENRGHMCLPKDDLIEDALCELNRNKNVSANIISKSDLIEKYNKLVAVEEIKEVDIESGLNFLRTSYLAENYLLEEKISKLILNRSSLDDSSGNLKSYLENFLSGNDVSDEQFEAIFKALTSSISVITGGPGTGKSYTVSKLVDSINRFFPESKVYLAAPTGKAARRLTELSGKKAFTIHRLLGYSKDKKDDKDEEYRDIECDYLILDEASMVDAKLFANILEHLKSGAKLILVGDPDQLASVDKGSVLEELIKSGKVSVTRLSKIFRQGKDSTIINASKLLTEGSLLGGRINTETNPDSDFFLFNVKKQNVIAIVEREIERRINEGYGLNDIQVLTSRKQNELGAINLNRLIQKKFNKQAFGKPDAYIYGFQRLYPGDRVVQMENNYDLKVMNGETGVYKACENGRYIVLFGEREVFYDDKNLEEISLAYALTVHKSQGSEFPVVIYVVDEDDDIITSRNTVYTAWTRAKEKLYTIGNLEYLNNRLKEDTLDYRYSGLGEMVKHPLLAA